MRTIDPSHLPESMKPAGTSKRGPILLIAAVAALLVLYVIIPPADVSSSGGSVRGVRRAGSIPNRMDFAIVSDLDKRSLVAGKKPKWRAVFKRGTLVHEGDAYSVEWKDDIELKSAHGEAGRGMELSELVLWQGKMYTIDDRSGIVFEVVDYNGDSPFVVPRYILMEGDGNTDKGFKGEWMSVIKNDLVVGSFGKEYTNPDGSVKNTNNNWVVIIHPDGSKEHADWAKVYDGMREKVGMQRPGYMIHEAGTWSETLQRWVFLPRRMSKEPYNEDVDERKGANSIFTLKSGFSDVVVSTVGEITPERGFSTFKFVPGSNDQVVFALKSAENGAADTQTTFMTVFGMDGTVYMPETEIAGGMKFEGLEFF